MGNILTNLNQPIQSQEFDLGDSKMIGTMNPSTGEQLLQRYGISLAPDVADTNAAYRYVADQNLRGHQAAAGATIRAAELAAGAKAAQDKQGLKLPDRAKLLQSRLEGLINPYDGTPLPGNEEQVAQINAAIDAILGLGQGGAPQQQTAPVPQPAPPGQPGVSTPQFSSLDIEMAGGDPQITPVQQAFTEATGTPPQAGDTPVITFDPQSRSFIPPWNWAPNAAPQSAPVTAPPIGTPAAPSAPTPPIQKTTATPTLTPEAEFNLTPEQLGHLSRNFTPKQIEQMIIQNAIEMGQFKPPKSMAEHLLEGYRKNPNSFW
jgi:hypothetical protein